MFPKTCHKTTKQTKQKKHQVPVLHPPWTDRHPISAPQSPTYFYELGFLLHEVSLISLQQLMPSGICVHVVASSSFAYITRWTLVGVLSSRCKLVLNSLVGTRDRDLHSDIEGRIVVERGRQSLGEISNEGQSEKKWETCIQHRR